MNQIDLQGRVAVVTGGAQGIGFAAAERLLKSGASVALWDIDAARLAQAEAALSTQGVVSRVSLGVERAQEANASIKQIGAGSRNAVTMVEEITAAIREQGTATNDIAQQVERIAQMSEESSAAAANSAQAAQDLDRLATEMQRVVSAYRL